MSRKVRTDESSEGETQQTGEVVFLDAFTEIPEPKFPLKETGQKTYQERCGVLLKRGLLTVATKDLVEMLAVADDALFDAVSNGGKNLRAASEMKRAALLKLDKLDADQTIASPGQDKKPFRPVRLREKSSTKASR